MDSVWGDYVVNMNTMSSDGRPLTATGTVNRTVNRTVKELQTAQAKNKHRPLSPLRSSHRVGPVGRLGSSSTCEGENRWRPPICSYVKPESVLDPEVRVS